MKFADLVSIRAVPWMPNHVAAIVGPDRTLVLANLETGVVKDFGSTTLDSALKRAAEDVCAKWEAEDLDGARRRREALGLDRPWLSLGFFP